MERDINRLTSSAFCNPDVNQRTPTTASLWVVRSNRLKLAITMLLAPACSDWSERTAQQEEATTTIPVTGVSGPTMIYQQSETGLNVQTLPTGNVATAAYNDLTYEDSGGYVNFTPTDRFIFPGASQLGYSFSVNGGAFQYGYPTPSSKLRPPPGWSVLWGDPAITGSRAYQQYVYISNVAVNNASFPASGFIEGSVTFGSGGKQSFISGACIARSSDYGQTFSLAASDCVKNVTAVPTGDFYDGGSMESDLEGRIYASWVNWSTGSIDVWWAQTPTSSFTRIITPTGPLAGFTAESHARLRYDPIADRIYLMALVDPIAPVFGDSNRNTGHLMIDYFDPNSGTWHGAVNVANDCLDQPDIIRGTILGLPAKLRTAVSFSFDVGRASPSGGDDIRIVYAGETSALPAAHLKSVVCSRGLACMGGTMNTLGSPGEQFNPLVVAQYGFLSIPSQWKVSWSSTEFDPGLSGTTLSTMETDFGNFPIIATFNQPLCPDQRGYWGDYDDMQILSAAAGANTFIRARTESADRCQYRTLFAAKPLHVTALEFQ